MKNNKKSCNTCSYYITDENISNLSREEQIEFENFNTDSLTSIENSELERLAYLLQRLKSKTCVGGLVGINEIRKHCKYYKILPSDFDKNQLLQSFIANSGKYQSKTNIVISIVLGIITILVSLYGVLQNTQNKELENKIKQNEFSYQGLIIENKNLNDSIIILKRAIHNKILENE